MYIAAASPHASTGFANVAGLDVDASAAQTNARRGVSVYQNAFG